MTKMSPIILLSELKLPYRESGTFFTQKPIGFERKKNHFPLKRRGAFRFRGGGFVGDLRNGTTDG